MGFRGMSERNIIGPLACFLVSMDAFNWAAKLAKYTGISSGWELFAACVYLIAWIGCGIIQYVGTRYIK
jgi:hypothetical protein